MAQRIQRKRTRGWKMPANAVSVTRPGPYGNKFVVGVDGDAATCVELYRQHMERLREASPDYYRALLEPLRGKDLACWCATDVCHASVLLELARELE